MTHILTEAAWWLLAAILNGPAWFHVSCMAFCLWAAEHWRIRL